MPKGDKYLFILSLLREIAVIIEILCLNGSYTPNTICEVNDCKLIHKSSDKQIVKTTLQPNHINKF